MYTQPSSSMRWGIPVGHSLNVLLPCCLLRMGTLCFQFRVML